MKFEFSRKTRICFVYRPSYLTWSSRIFPSKTSMTCA